MVSFTESRFGKVRWKSAFWKYLPGLAGSSDKGGSPESGLGSSWIPGTERN